MDGCRWTVLGFLACFWFHWLFLVSADCVFPCLFGCVESLLLVWHQVPCLFVHLSVCGDIAIGVTPGAMSVSVWSHCYWCDTRCHVSLYICQCVESLLLVWHQVPCLFVHLSVCGVIAVRVTPGAMSVHLFVSVWSHCCWCDTRCHVCLFIC